MRAQARCQRVRRFALHASEHTLGLSRRRYLPAVSADSCLCVLRASRWQSRAALDMLSQISALLSPYCFGLHLQHRFACLRSRAPCGIDPGAAQAYSALLLCEPKCSSSGANGGAVTRGDAQRAASEDDREGTCGDLSPRDGGGFQTHACLTQRAVRCRWAQEHHGQPPRQLVFNTVDADKRNLFASVASNQASSSGMRAVERPE